MSAKGKRPQRETLEIEDDDSRLHRIQRTLEKLNSTSPGARRDGLNVLNSASASDLGSGSEQSLNDLLARVQAFLPDIEASNAALAEKAAMDPRSVDIENVDGDAEVIQMNLGLGVFEDRTGREGTCSSSGESSGADDSEDESEENTESSDEKSSSDSGDDYDDLGPETQERQIAPLPRSHSKLQKK
ncbi:hypothetical protein GGX14DRAFT_676857 [Mycena pura]|uniref:Uncharacterized protein n=1 Tax=Mycena pura TaxID=153505 RepID=A0AAD6V291_9AGAR|nr:hypothetical protein GGX14DRAFT_676857 [Mycena pura]